MIPMFWPYVPKDEILKELDKTLSGRWVGEGPRVKDFESEFGDYVGNKNCVAVNSCTSALELAYDIIGLSAEDEVIVPVLTCTATNHPLARRGCKLVWADVDPSTLCPSVEDINRKITAKTIAVVVVHLNGNVVDVSAIKPGPIIIEDCAQSLGGFYRNGTPVGSSRNFSAFSFQAIKHITTGDGGMLACPSREIAKTAKRRRWFGIDREAKIQAGWHSQIGHRLTFQVTELGYKYQMTDIQATFGLVQLRHLPHIMETRRKMYFLYRDLLDGVNGVVPFKWEAGHALWTFGIFAKNREFLMQKLKEHGVESNLVQIRNDIYEVFGGDREHLPNMNKAEDLYMYLPFHMNLKEADIRRVCNVIKRYAEAESGVR